MMVKKELANHLKPVLCSILSEEEVHKIADHLQKKNVITLEEPKYNEKPSLISSLIDSVVASRKNAKPWGSFVDLIKDSGKITLCKVIEKFLSSAKASIIYWLISHWKLLTTCGAALDGIAHNITDLCDDFPTPMKWIEIIYCLSCTNQNSLTHFFTQLKINISCTYETEMDVIHSDCFSSLFKPLFKDCLEEEDCIEIASMLHEEKLIQTEHFDGFKKTKKKQTKLLSIFVNHYSSSEFLKGFVAIIKNHACKELAELMDIFIKSNNKNLIFLLSNWSKLLQNQIWVGDIVCDQKLFNKEALKEMEKTCLLSVVHKLVCCHENAVESCMTMLRKKFDILKISLSEHMETNDKVTPMEVSKDISNEEMMEQKFDVSSSHKDQACSVVKGDAQNLSYQHDSESLNRNPLIQVELRVVVDKVLKVDANAQLKALLQTSYDKTSVLLEFDESRNVYRGFIQVCTLQPIVYKYVIVDYDNEIWEKIPISGVVNREIKLFEKWPNKIHVILFDVVTFFESKMLKSEFLSMYSRNMGCHLPSISTISLLKTGFTWILYLKELEMWCMGALAGIEFDDHNHLNNPITIFPTCRSLLKKYLEDYATYGSKSNLSSDICKRVLAFLAVLIVANRYKIFHKKEDFFENLSECISIGICLNDIFQEDLEILCSLICLAESSLIEEAKIAILEILTNSKHSYVCLRFFPLYYILLNNLSFTYDEKLWKKASNALKLAQKCSYKDAAENQKVVIGLVKNFPEIMTIYQCISPMSAILHFVNESASIVQHLKPIEVLMSQLSSSDIYFKKFFGSKNMSDWILESLENLEEQCHNENFVKSNIDYITKIKKAFDKYFQKSRVLHDSDLSYRNFCKVFVKAVSCFSSTIEAGSNFNLQNMDLHKNLISLIESGCASSYIPIPDYKIQIWNIFLTTKLVNNQLTQQWHVAIKEIIKKILTERLFSRYFEYVFDVFEKTIESKERLPEIEVCFSESLFNYAVTLKYEDEQSNFFRKFFQNMNVLEKSQYMRLVQFFEKLFLDSWKKLFHSSDPISSVINFVTSWPFTLQFFQLFGNDEKKYYLHSDVAKIMQLIVNHLKQIDSDLQTGMILYKHLQEIYNCKMDFGEILNIIIKNTSCSILSRRYQEMNVLQKIIKSLYYFYSICNSTDNVSFDINSLVQLLSDIDNVSWCKIFNLDCNAIKDIDIIYFSLSIELQSIANEMLTFKIGDNKIIKKIWSEEAKKFCYKKNTPKILNAADFPCSRTNSEVSEDSSSCSSDASDLSYSLTDSKDLYDDQNLPVMTVAEIPSLWRLVKQNASKLARKLLSGSLTLFDAERLFQNLLENEPKQTNLLQLLIDLCHFSLELQHRNSENTFTQSLVKNADRCQFEYDLNYNQASLSLVHKDTFDHTISESLQNLTFSIDNLKNKDLKDAQNFKDSDVHDLDVMVEVETPDKDITICEKANEKDEVSSIAASTKSETSFENDIDLCEQSFVNLDSSEIENLLQKRISQIHHFFALKYEQNIASAFSDLKECLDLKGDFSYLEIVQEQNNLTGERLLTCITDDVIKASEIIYDINEKDLSIVRHFMEQKELIYWLRENMQNRGEVKVLSDLAMISAGETAMEVDKVSCFLSAVMGFAPFIFDLEENSDLKSMLDSFQKVVERSGHSKLKEQWNATAQYLDWLKGIKDFHGSVEKSSLARAQDINSQGIYTIGQEQDKITTPDNALKLNIETNKVEESKSMSLADLHNLESRLMLIAGEAEKGLDDVKVFTEILSLVKNLTKVYVKLKSNGCLLFYNWTAKLRYNAAINENDSGTNLIEIQFDDHSPSIFCKDNIKEELKKLTDVMETIYLRWNKNLIKKRQQFYHLNYFNIQQIMYLCKELATVTEFSDIPNQVFTLLEFVKSDVKKPEIISILSEATKLPDTEDDKNDFCNEEIALISDMQQKQKMVKNLINAEIPERLAKAAVQVCAEENGFPLDYDSCYMKALELETEEYDEDDKNSLLVEKFDVEAGFDATSSQVGVIQSVISDQNAKTLQDVIHEILNHEAEESVGVSMAVKTIGERYLTETALTSLSDCISIEHLGIFLANLSVKAGKKFIPERMFPEEFDEGKPNLVICPENDMFSTLLSIYMLSNKEKLPSLSEVLLCSENTSKDEVELFLRRAIMFNFDTGSCIYCLASAEKLSFEVSNATDNMIKLLEKETESNPKYRLVILSSSPQHFVASLLFENRVEYVNRVTQDQLQSYLTNHMPLHTDLKCCLHQENHFEIETSMLVITSNKSGLGKSLHIQRCHDRLPTSCRFITIRFLNKNLDETVIMNHLLPAEQNINNAAMHFLHFDITPSVQFGVSNFLFKLLILGGFSDAYGNLWCHYPKHCYVLEFTKSFIKEQEQKNFLSEHSLFNILPTFRCLSPREIVSLEAGEQPKYVLFMDPREFESDIFQRSYQYLQQYQQGQNLDYFRYIQKQGTPYDCIKVLLAHCSIYDPSWSELRHFASFLSSQLNYCEKSVFCDSTLVGTDSGLSGFKNFVVRFMIRMSQDFATPSLVAASDSDVISKDVFEHHQLRRRWEEDAHAYLFFNEDNISLTFFNFYVDQRGNLLHSKQPTVVLDPNLIPPTLLQGLQAQKVNLNQNFDTLPRPQKLITLCRIMGLNERFQDDPDPTYELTTDNVLKILAIHMRFRCGIPVVIMGETGCGKTRMVQFMSNLVKAARISSNSVTDENDDVSETKKVDIQNMVVVKVHGGITVSMIQSKMKKAAELAQANTTNHNIDTMLFLDEANTTEAIYAIKEYVCDKTINGKAVIAPGLKIICACNPYRKHSPEAVQKMAEAGLGFRVKTEDTIDKLGAVPMRCLVYRVIALPPSMQPLVWDFGQLSEQAERVYIHQMVSKLQLQLSSNSLDLLVEVLSASQEFMRKQRDQCLFVSLRDVERCLLSFQWFYKQRSWLFDLIDKNGGIPLTDFHFPQDLLRPLIQAIGMCYHVTLEEREPYRTCISQCLKLYDCTLTPEDILLEITACQTVFSSNLNLDENIACNEALRENSFMIAMCTEMRIPLFLIGKPGSSKSLAKTVVTDAMQGTSSRSKIFRKLKQIHVLSFQCSAVSDAVGIEAVFTQCAQVQARQDYEKFVSVVVLDEVGLAEDSPKMPLKVLHPLLEGISVGSDNEFRKSCDAETIHNQVGFVGISNWALDPAKMNRGIFVIRGDPSKNDLQLTAKGIFLSDVGKFKEVDKIVKLLTDSYIDIRKKQEQEFFGLRDYYGLLKMIFSIVKMDNVDLDNYHIANAIKRNFSGGQIDSFEIFLPHLKTVWPNAKESTISLRTMIRHNLQSVDESESRFLLLLTNRFAAVTLLDKVVDSRKFQVIFGSSFPRDNDYTELCRNINKIKICMESGCTVVLLNLRDLYESLYDALNQHYVTFAGQRYVDLGLGGHRVKCRISKKFRLIVIEDKNVVYDEFPIPLINRLEKYVFTSESVLDQDQLQLSSRIHEWIYRFSNLDIPFHERRRIWQFAISQCFLGYSEDSSASAVLLVSDVDVDTQIYSKAQNILLKTATIDSVFRLQRSKLKKEAEKLQQQYLFHQSHDNLVLFFKSLLHEKIDFTEMKSFVYEITSFSHILGEHDRQKLERVLDLPKNSIMLLTLQQFQTQEDYNAKLEFFFDFSLSSDKQNLNSNSTFILFIQCPQAPKHGNLIACARYSLKNMILQKIRSSKEQISASIFIAFLYSMDRQSGKVESNSSFTFNSCDFTSVFIDELRPSVEYIGSPSRFWNRSISEVFSQSLNPRSQVSDSISNFSFNYLFDPIKLVQSCIPAAMVKVISHGGSMDRNRMHLMHTLFDNIENPVSKPFQQILLQRVSDLLTDRDKKLLSQGSQWSVQEACSQESLYEGGTFSKTLWLRLKKIIQLCLAKIVSVIDEDNNLEILRLNNPLLLDFWLTTFENTEICKFTTNEILTNAQNFEIRGHGKFSCQFPFSRRIAEWFKHQWDFIQSLLHLDKDKKFFEKIAETSFGSKLRSTFAEKPLEAAKCFINDLVCIQCEILSVGNLELELLQKSLNSVFKSKLSDPHCDNYLEIAYCTFITNRQLFSHLYYVLEVLPCLVTEQNVNKWLALQKECANFIVHCLVYQDALIYLEENLNNFVLPSQYHQWKNTVQKVLNLKVDLRLFEAKQIVENKRGSIAFVDLFLSVLVPENLSEIQFKNYLGILAPLSKRLGKGASITGLTNPKFLKIVMDILRNCSRDLHLKLVLSWNDIACKRCHKPKMIDPVILPCNHCFCKKCIELATLSRVHECPICRQRFPDDFQLRAAQLLPESIEEFETFKRSCTSFFLQYLSSLCFPAEYQAMSLSTVNKTIWTTLQNLVICKKSTRELTPINMEEFDENPTVRSFILQLLLRFHRENTEHVLEEHFKKMKDVLLDIKELMLIFLRCVEDCLQVQANNAKKEDEQKYFNFVNDLIVEVEEQHFMETKSQIKTLDLVAKLRYIMKVTAKSIHFLYLDYSNEDIKGNLRLLVCSVCKMLKSANFLLAKNFFLKILCRQYGFGNFQLLLDEDEFLYLVPEDLNTRDLDRSVTLKSSLFLLGKAYKTTLSSLFSVQSEENFDEALDDLCSTASESCDMAVQVFHGIQSWMTSCDQASSLREQFQAKFIANLSDHDVDEKMVNFFDSFVPIIKDSPATELLGFSEGILHILSEFFEVTGSTIVSSSVIVLNDLHSMIVNPSLIKSYFLPTMPQSVFFDVKNIVSTWINSSYNTPPKPYKCPNGHVYFIGDCTQPYSSGICPQCKQTIGGVSHGKLQPGNVAGGLDESSQAGYLLGSPSNRPLASVPERNCSRLVVCVIRMFLHATLLHACENGDSLVTHLKQNDLASTKHFLFHHLLIDFNQLVECLGKSADDTALLLHQILKNMRSQKDFLCSSESTLSTMKGRQIWEDEFSRLFLSPVFEKADEIIDQARALCWSSQTQNDLEKIVYEIPLNNDENDKIVDEIDVETEFLWNYQINVNVSHLRQKLEGMSTQEYSEGRVLKLILNETDLALIQHLPQILALQRSLIQRYQRKVDARDVEEILIGDYIDEDERTVSSESFQLYIDSWNRVRKNLPCPNAYSLSEEDLRVDMNLSSPISMCLPSSVGCGRCALLMNEYLLEKQNNLLTKCRELMITPPSFSEISVDQLSKDDLLCIDNEESLMPIILSNSQYEVTKSKAGTKHKIVYWIPALEKQVIEKFILNKKLLDKNSLPQIRYLQDMGLGAECERMKKNVPQVPLPPKISQKLSEICSRSRPADVCEGVRTIVLVISYLAKLESSREKLLISYVTGDLMLSPEEASMFPKSAQLCHTMALYERLSLQRSLMFFKNGQNPFANLNMPAPDLSEDEDFVDEAQIKRALEKIDVPSLQHELNSMILLREELNPYSSLRDNLEECIKEKNSNDDNNHDTSWIKYLPEKLKVIDAPRLFKISVRFDA